ELGVLLLPPAGAQPDLDAPAADLVDGRGRLRQQRRLAERGRRHERAEPDARRASGECAQQRPGVRRAASRDAPGAEVMIGSEQSLVAEPLARLREREPVRPPHALLALDHHARTHLGSLATMSERADAPSEMRRVARAVVLGLVLGTLLALLSRTRRRAS